MFCKKAFISFIVTLLSIMFSTSGFAQDFDEDFSIPPNKIEKQAYEKYILNKENKDYRYTKDTVIDEDTKIDGNVIVTDGNLTVKGEIDGDVLVILGNIYIKTNALINGCVTSINGRIYQNEKSDVSGNQIETKVKNLFSRHEWDRDFDVHDEDFESWDYKYIPKDYRRSYSTLPLGKWDDPFLIRYNRVQGLFLGMAIPKKIRGKYNYFSPHGFGGYSFEEKCWRYELGVDRWLFNQKDFRFEIGGKFYDLTDTKDNWLITPTENSLAAFFIHEDFQDFYRRNGYELHISQNLSIFLKGTLAYRNDKYESVEKNIDWALFGGDKKFAGNPEIDDGYMRSIYGELYLDTRNNKDLPVRGWYGKISVETSNSKLNSDFSFNQYIFELRRYQTFGRYERIDMRFRAGSSAGNLPLQKTYKIGGISTLRGFDYKEFSGNRMLLANFEYNISPKMFTSNFLFFDGIRYVTFLDLGAAWFTNNLTDKNEWTAKGHEGFSHLKWNDIKCDFGVALTSSSGRCRLSIAKRTDSGIDPIVVTFRLSKPF